MPIGGTNWKRTFDMEEFQHRVVNERLELDVKIGLLAGFVRTGIFKELPPAEAARMERQLSIMREYSEVLGERIAAF